MIIESLDVVLYTAIFLLPGYLIEGIVNMLYLNHTENDFRSLFRFMAYSIINLAVWSWAYVAIDSYFTDKSIYYWVSMVTATLLGSIIISIIIGFIKQKKILESIFARTSLTFKGASPTAWDFKFFDLEECFITVTLKNGNQYNGYYGGESNTSCEVIDRDIYIEKLYSVDYKGKWTVKPQTGGIYIKGEEISTIEYFQ